MIDARAAVAAPGVFFGIVLRAALIWTLLRFGLFLLGADLDGPIAAAGVVALGSTLAGFDARLTRELLFLRNLGMPVAWLVAVTAAVMLLLESGLRLAL